MERLVTTAQAAEILGLSLQGVHYRIRKKQLKSLKKSGKTYVYINESQEPKPKEEPTIELKEFIPNETIKEIVKAKDEQIEILKKSIKWMKKQYGSEIIRLEKNQKRIIGVFNREIELLQSAFNEMRSIYKPQLEFNQQQAQNTYKQNIQKEKFITLQNFSVFMKKHNKTSEDIKLIILKAIKNQDERFIYNKRDKKLLILNEDFSDLI
ncbi:DNA-binding protein [Halarcobacter sp.]|uniref:DNA-binding protein n=1 Tax=Halarcobacter sp. TaxID=2321133 RepID=UPI002AAAF8DC|nr:DNA-binding protein [Halarcobacter sp.]